MSNADPSVRASAMQHFINSLGTANGEASMGQAVPVLIAALNDPDVKVRQLGAVGLRGIAAATSHIVYPSVGNGPDLTANASTQDALLKATSDSDPTVSRMALLAYALTYKLTPELEQKIIDTFNSYKSTPGQSDDRFELLGSLVNDRSPSPVAVRFIVQKIDDPQFGVTALQSLGSLKKPPTDVLPKLLNEAGQHNISKDRKSALTLAVKAYGPNAQAQLEQIPANPR
jgi:HEAT repeat protein